MGIGKEGYVTDILAPKLLDRVLHQGFAESFPLKFWVNDDIPDCGIEGMVGGGSGESNQASSGTALLPHRCHQEAVLNRFADFTQGTPRPTDGVAKFLEFVEIDIPFRAEQYPGARGGAIALPIPCIPFKLHLRRGSIRTAKEAFPKTHSGTAVAFSY
jgi:hypothetical protein